MDTEAKCEAEQQHNAQADTVADKGDSDSDDVRVCWICRDSEIPEDCLTTGVCLCRGSIAWVHQKCIDQWVFTQRRVRCPSCDVEYNVVSNHPVIPTTLINGIYVLLPKLAIPLLYKILVLGLGIMVNIFLVPGLIGVAHYHWNVFRLDMNANSTTTPMLLDDHVLANSSGSTTLSVGFNDVDGKDDTGELRGFWLWTTLLIYGWINVALWRSVCSAWRQWREFFNRVQNNIAPARPVPFTYVEYAHWVVDICQDWTDCSRGAVARRIMELSVLAPFAYVLSFPVGKVAIIVTLGIIAVLWRLRFDRKRIRDPMRRFMEAQERKEDASDVDIALWFCTYISETILFSIFLPVCAGIVLRFGVSPYLLPMPESLMEFGAQLSVLQLIGYWFLGSTCSLTLMHVESTFIVPLFAPGVDLFFIRSVDLNIEGGSVYWSFIVAQVFDADPLRVIVDFVRMSCIELTALYVFVAAPLYATFAFHRSLDTSSAFLVPQDGEILLDKSWSVDLDLAPFELRNIAVLGQDMFFAVVRTVYWMFDSQTLRWWTDGTLLIFGIGTIIMCVRMYPLQRMQLKMTRPLVMWLSKNIFHLDAFLFDAERLEILDRWLRGNGRGELQMPEVPLAMVFVRRERGIPPEHLPKYFKARHVVFSILFYVLGTSIFWAGPVFVMGMMLLIFSSGVPTLCASLNLFFLLMNPGAYLTAVGEFLLLCIVVVIGIFIQPVLACVPLLDVSWQQLVQDTLEYTMDVKRTVGRYRVVREEGAIPSDKDQLPTEAKKAHVPTTAATSSFSSTLTESDEEYDEREEITEERREIFDAA